MIEEHIGWEKVLHQDAPLHPIPYKGFENRKFLLVRDDNQRGRIHLRLWRFLVEKTARDPL